jgi:hypothetical protein
MAGAELQPAGGSILRKHLQDEAKRRLSDWADRNKDSQSGKDVKKLLNKFDDSPLPGEGAGMNLVIQFFLFMQRYKLNLLHAMVFNLERFVDNRPPEPLPGCGIRCKYSISKPAMVWYSRFHPAAAEHTAPGLQAAYGR